MVACVTYFVDFNPGLHRLVSASTPPSPSTDRLSPTVTSCSTSKTNTTAAVTVPDIEQNGSTSSNSTNTNKNSNPLRQIKPAFVPLEKNNINIDVINQDEKRKVKNKMGSSTNESNQGKQQMQGQRQRTLMDYESIALALTYTCNINKQLQQPNKQKHKVVLPQEQHKQQQRKRKSTTDAFHINENDDAYYWSKDQLKSNLYQFIHSLSIIFEYEQNPHVPAIALLYLDRACSIKSHDSYMNSNNIYLRCPFMTFESVYKLYLTAVVLACRTVRNEFPTKNTLGCHDEHTEKYVSLLHSTNENNETKSHYSILKGINITQNELGHLLEHMIESIG